MLRDERFRRVPGALKPFVMPRVIYQRRLDAFRGCHRERARHHSRRNAGHQIAQGRERTGLRILERALDAVERNEPDRVLEHRARHERLASLVQRPRTFLFDHRFDHLERISGRTVLVELDSGLGEFECYIAPPKECQNSERRPTAREPRVWPRVKEDSRYVIVASTPPAVPPAMSETSGVFSAPWHKHRALSLPHPPSNLGDTHFAGKYPRLTSPETILVKLSKLL